MNSVALTTPIHLPELVVAAGERASMRFLEFFAANIRNPHTRRAYYRAAGEFLTWCADAGVFSIAAVQPVHVATWIEASTRELAAPSVKQRLAARCCPAFSRACTYRYADKRAPFVGTPLLPDTRRILNPAGSEASRK
jgi:hypothetical protein